MNSRTSSCFSSSSQLAPMVRISSEPRRSLRIEEHEEGMGIHMRVIRGALVVTTLALSAVGASAQGTLNVVTTTEDLAAIAREVGGDKITVESMARGYQDPHFVEAKP